LCEVDVNFPGPQEQRQKKIIFSYDSRTMAVKIEENHAGIKLRFSFREREEQEYQRKKRNNHCYINDFARRCPFINRGVYKIQPPQLMLGINGGGCFY
jgi:hypothetical protein